MSVNFLNLFAGRIEKKLAQALERYQASPGEAETLLVAQLLMKKRDYNQAFMYADNGYQRFPDSQELLALRQLSMKKLAIEECRELQASIARAPRPESIAKVIEIRRSLNDFKACEKMCRKWSAQFSESWVLQFAIAKYLFGRSMVEKDPELSRRCLEQLEKAAVLNPDNYKTLLYLATLQHQLGKKSSARTTVQHLLELFPEDARARSLLAYIDGPARGPGAGGGRGEGEVITPAAILEELQALPSVHAVLLNRVEDDAYVADEVFFRPSEIFEWEEGEEALRSLLHSMESSSQRMGIGQLEGCKLLGDSWSIHYQTFEGGSLLYCADQDLKEEKIREWKQKTIRAPETINT